MEPDWSIIDQAEKGSNIPTRQVEKGSNIPKLEKGSNIPNNNDQSIIINPTEHDKHEIYSSSKLTSLEN